MMVVFSTIGQTTFASEDNPFPTEADLEGLTPSSRQALLEYIADREAEKASENPDLYNEEKKDITIMERAGAMTGEMAKFYMAVAFLEYSNCLTSGDATICSQFMEGLKDPIGHIGFAIFMKGNKMTMDLAQIVTRGKINPGMASYMGLAGGMMAQTVFQDLYYHPLTQELLKNASERDPKLRTKNRKEILNKMWAAVKTDSGRYLIDKIPNVAGLLGAAYLSHKTMQLMGYGAGKAGKVMANFKRSASTGKLLVEISEDLKVTKSLQSSSARVVFKYVNAAKNAKNFKSAARLVRLNPVVAIGSYLIETVVFLMWAPVVEDFFIQQWDQSKIMGDLIKAEKGLSELGQYCFPPNLIKEKTQKFAQGLDRWRETIMHKANNTKMRHLTEINKIDEQYQKMAMYYAWLVEGADMDSEFYKANEISWHEDFIIKQINESTDYIEEFFCGKNPEDVVFRTVSYGGIPVPGSKSFDYDYDANRTLWDNMQANMSYEKPTGIVLGQPRVMRIPGLCRSDMRTVKNEPINFWTHGNYEDVICPLDYDVTNKKITWKKNIKAKLHCQLELSWARHHVLESGKLKGEDIREEIMVNYDIAFGEMMAKVWGQRDLMIMNFENSVRYELLKGLTGQTVEIDEETDRATVSGGVSYTGKQPNGFIPHLYFELSIWQGYKDRAEDSMQKEIFQEMADQTLAKIKAAKEVLEFIKKPYRERIRNVDTDIFQEVKQEEWQKIIRTLREYVIN